MLDARYILLYNDKHRSVSKEGAIKMSKGTIRMYEAEEMWAIETQESGTIGKDTIWCKTQAEAEKLLAFYIRIGYDLVAEPIDANANASPVPSASLDDQNIQIGDSVEIHDNLCPSDHGIVVGTRQMAHVGGPMKTYYKVKVLDIDPQSPVIREANGEYYQDYLGRFLTVIDCRCGNDDDPDEDMRCPACGQPRRMTADEIYERAYASRPVERDTWFDSARYHERYQAIANGNAFARMFGPKHVDPKARF